MILRGAGRSIANNSAAVQRQRFLGLAVKLQNELYISQPVQKACMNDMHQMRKIQRSLRTFGPSSIAAEEFSGPSIPHQTLHRFLKFHASNFS